MAGNLTLTVDEEVLRTARRVAEERGKSLDRLVEDYLIDLCPPGVRGPVLARRFAELAKNSSAAVGEVTWTREELHDRSKW